MRRPLPLPPGLPRRVRPQLEGLPSTCSSLESMRGEQKQKSENMKYFHAPSYQAAC